ncbi:argininosuccinate lyase [Ekhidna sp.]|uniref:argininosuccinate lyase n=1 Tax=Ekhidna sp. TaxID=2608089 RepID=UPI003298B3FD
MKLWDKNEPIDQLFERFTIGKDKELDLELAYFDVLGTIGHVKMLGKISLLKEEEVEILLQELEEIKELAIKGDFMLEEGVEDCHSQIELLLTNKLGDVGKKVHAGRSRNDQVLTALKLFTKHNLAELVKKVKTLFELLQEKSESNKDYLMPGYTHMQVAMPSSFGLWFGAYAESLIDDLLLFKMAYQIADKNPLGSGAGYGSSFPLDREYSTDVLDFAALNHNVVYAQMTRGKNERSASFAISSLASTLAKYAMDICLFAGDDYGFLKLDSRYTTGSSIMPHKHNPDGFELVRAKCNKLQNLPQELNMILANLPSGYHRDLQVLKESYMPAFQQLMDCLDVTIAMTGELEVNKEVIDQKKYDLLFTVEEVNRRVIHGVPFRDAYKEVAKLITSGKYQPDKNLRHTHLGSIGNLANDQIKAVFKKEYSWFQLA